MTDYSEVCWYCGSSSMEKVETWFRCLDCGATHVPSLDIFKGDLIESESSTATDEDGNPYRSYHPSKRVAQEAAKARRKAKSVV